MTSILPEMAIPYVIASDPGTIMPIHGVGFSIREPSSFHRVSHPLMISVCYFSLLFKLTFNLIVIIVIALSNARPTSFPCGLVKLELLSVEKFKKTKFVGAMIVVVQGLGHH